MLGKGLEPSSQRHTHLKRTCIPVPSPQHRVNPSQGGILYNINVPNEILFHQ